MSERPEKKPPQHLLDWLGITEAPNWSVARPLGRAVGALMVLAVPLLFLTALVAAFAVAGHTIWQTIHGGTEASPNLGAGALIAALLGAPFLIWGTVLKHQTVRWQKEGHMTDRISKAVEQLGSEKTIEQYSLDQDHRPIQAKRTVPNLEVRIGAILSLERIAQDSTTHDKGRDHVRVMEILCAYIRENAPASAAQDHTHGEWKPLKDDPTEEERADHLRRRTERLDGHVGNGLVREWAEKLSRPREDIALALRVIARRTRDQLMVEAAWPDSPDSNTDWPFDRECPSLPDEPGAKPLSDAALAAYKKELDAWVERARAYSAYRLDLRDTNLQGADMVKGQFRAARLANARLEGANLGQARLEGAVLRLARMEGADLRHARLEGANLGLAWMEGAKLGQARMEGAVLRQARMEGANLMEARMEGAILIEAQMEGANLRQSRMARAHLKLARMEGADIRHARMEGAVLRLARLDEKSFLTAAHLHGAALREVDWSRVVLSAEQVKASFGDASVVLPAGIERPPHWPNSKLGDAEFLEEWRSWQKASAADGCAP